ncbi:MAG: hypothetical protein UHS49_07000 [Faecalimonas sp.]|nr:hypothetical protein [Faecalimonas sp.]
MLAFIIWSIVALLFVAIGIRSWKSKNAVGFFSFVAPPEIKESKIKGYNHAVSVLWFVFAGALEAMGVPFLFCKQNSPIFFVIAIGVMFLVIGMMVAYMKIASHYKK